MNRFAMAVTVVGCGMVVAPGSAVGQCPATAVAVSAATEIDRAYEPCNVDTPARLRRRSPLAYNRGRFSGDPMVAEVMFVVDTMGSPERGSVHLADLSSPELEFAITTAVMRQLYEPAMRQGRKVRQVATYSWMLYGGRPRDIDPTWRSSAVSTPPGYSP